MHTISDEEEDRVLKWGYGALNKGGFFFLELRSIKDNLYNKGIKKENGVSITDHYRRFADLDKLKDKLKKEGFRIIQEKESRGLAIYKDEDPIVIRLIAKK